MYDSSSSGSNVFLVLVPSWLVRRTHNKCARKMFCLIPKSRDPRQKNGAYQLKGCKNHGGHAILPTAKPGSEGGLARGCGQRCVPSRSKQGK